MNKYRVLRNGKCVREIDAENLAEAKKLNPRLVGGRRSKSSHGYYMPYEWQRLEDNKEWAWVS